MTLATGSAVGQVNSQETLILEGAPYIYFQSASATPLKNPDPNGYYWGLSGTVVNPVYLLGCVQDIALGEDVTLNSIRCDSEADKNAVQKRNNYLEVTLTVQHLLPLTTTYHLMNISVPTYTSDIETVGIGSINNNRYYMVYMPKVYDEDAGDYMMVHLHRCQFVEAWSLQMRSGDAWQLTGVRIRGFWDSTKPAGSEFGTIMRSDVSAI